MHDTLGCKRPVTCANCPEGSNDYHIQNCEKPIAEKTWAEIPAGERLEELIWEDYSKGSREKMERPAKPQDDQTLASEYLLERVILMMHRLHRPWYEQKENAEGDCCRGRLLEANSHYTPEEQKRKWDAEKDSSSYLQTFLAGLDACASGPLCLDIEEDLRRVRNVNKRYRIDHPDRQYGCAFCETTRAQRCGSPAPISETGYRNLRFAYLHMFGIYDLKRMQGKNKCVETAHLEFPLAEKVNLHVREIRNFRHVQQEYMRILGTVEAVENLIESIQDGATSHKIVFTEKWKAVVEVDGALAADDAEFNITDEIADSQADDSS
ncbi:hypothetical protein PG993_008976 [Apiospora rasikravindrae]|uniref:Uncharacterized protein n=1 Tax=Apiospora rasikravindrae TaxID=990691 RepID=A0ABR1SJD0_9PEZI